MKDQLKIVPKLKSVIIDDAKSLFEWCCTTLSHIYQEANQRADHLTRLGAEAKDQVISIDIPMHLDQGVHD